MILTATIKLSNPKVKTNNGRIIVHLCLRNYGLKKEGMNVLCKFYLKNNIATYNGPLV